MYAGAEDDLDGAEPEQPGASVGTTDDDAKRKQPGVYAGAYMTLAHLIRCNDASLLDQVQNITVATFKGHSRSPLSDKTFVMPKCLYCDMLNSI